MNDDCHYDARRVAMVETMTVTINTLIRTALWPSVRDIHELTCRNYVAPRIAGNFRLRLPGNPAAIANGTISSGTQDHRSNFPFL